MATRRARVKLAPNLGARNKPRNIPPPPQPKIDISKCLESSEASDDEEVISIVKDITTQLKEETLNNESLSIKDEIFGNRDDMPTQINKEIGKEIIHEAISTKEETISLAKNLTTQLNEEALSTDNISNKETPTSSCDKPEENLHSNVDVNPSDGALNGVDTFDIVAKTIGTIPRPEHTNGDADSSDWEDDQFCYKTVNSADAEETLYKSLEITPLTATPADNRQESDVIKCDSALDAESDVKGEGDVSSTAKDNNQNIKDSNKQPGIVSSVKKLRLPIGRNKLKPNLAAVRLKTAAIVAKTSPISSKHPIASVPKSPTRSESESPVRSPKSPVRPASKSPVKFAPKSPSPSKPTPLTPNSDSDPDDPKMVFKKANVRNRMPQRSLPMNLHAYETLKQPDEQKRKMMRRKIDHKRKFMNGVPERSAMTMFDLIYYNPANGHRMSVDDDEATRSNADESENVPNVVCSEMDTNLQTPERGAAEDDEMPVPQVKVDANGEIVIDDSSLTVETTDVIKAKGMAQNSPVVYESNRSSTNYGTWSKKRKHSDWGKRETLKFYKALSVVGSDFSMMESLFKGKRTRQELKLKFKKEEKINEKIVDKCLSERGMYTEYKDIMDDSDEEEEMVEEKRKKKRNPKRRYVNRGYYDSSSDEELTTVELKPKTPNRKRNREPFSISRDQPVVRIKRPRVLEDIQRISQSSSISSSTITRTCVKDLRGSITVGKDGATAGPSGVNFPPGLLAANPGLVGARPGSLVVVASPNKTDPSNQLLHVYMVASKKVKDKGFSTSSAPKPTPQPFQRVTDSLVLDPAVVRAVDRGRLRNMSGTAKGAGRSRTSSESTEAFGRTRTMSESTDSDVNSARLAQTSSKKAVPGVFTSRQRTYSEGSGGDLRTRLVKQRFVEGITGPVEGISSTSNKNELQKNFASAESNQK